MSNSIDLFSADFDQRVVDLIPGLSSSDFDEAVINLSSSMTRARSHNICSLRSIVRNNLPLCFSNLGLDDHSALQASQMCLDYALISLSNPFRVSFADINEAVHGDPNLPANKAMELLSNQMLGVLAQLLNGAGNLLSEFMEDETVTLNTAIDIALEKIVDVASQNASKFEVIPMFRDSVVEQDVIKFIQNA